MTSSASVANSVQDRALSYKKKNLKKLIDMQHFNRQLVPNHHHQLKPVSDYEKARATLAAQERRKASILAKSQVSPYKPISRGVNNTMPTIIVDPDITIENPMLTA